MKIFQSLILFCWFFLGVHQTWAQGVKLLETPYVPSLQEARLEQFFEDIQSQTGITISFSSSFLNTSQFHQISGSEQTIGEVLSVLLDKYKVSLVERKQKILVVPGAGWRKEGCTISGYVRDKSNREVLIGVNVYIPALKVGTATNNFGFFSLTVPRGNYVVYVSYIGYKTDTLEFVCQDKLQMEVLLETKTTLQEVSIVSERSRPVSEGDMLQIRPADIYGQQALLGENEVLRALQQASPGVQAGIDGTSNLIVRGGDPGQNLYLLDGVPLYYVDHLFGLTSVYNTEAIKSADFYKGAFPARYGGRLSSVVDVHTKDGDMERIGGQFTMGLIKSTLNLEGPIVKDKASFMVSGRRTWVDGLILPFTNQIGIHFYDINAKGNWIVNKNNRLYLSYYSGRDQVRYSEGDESSLRTRWGNTIASLKWTSILTPKLFLNTTYTYSHFEYELKDRAEVIDSNGISEQGTYTGASKINESSLRLQAQWYPQYNHKIEVGGSYTYSLFEPTKLLRVNARIPLPVNPVSNEFSANEIMAYVEDEVKIDEKLLIRPGLHWANWISTQFNYAGLQPRLYASYRMRHNQLIFGSVSHMVQFLHLISNNSYGLPADFWVPSTEKIRPERGWVVTLGYSGKLSGTRFSGEAYYKNTSGVVVYTTGKNIFDHSPRWQDKIMQGRGWSYGVELAGDRWFGRVHASVTYALSWSWRRFELLNDGKPFPYRYDRRHNLKIATSCKLSESANMGINWTYMSGEAFTLPDQIYPDLDNNLLFLQREFTSAEYTYNYSDWNAYRLPAIHRLDVGFNFTKKRGEYYVRTWSFGAFNLYGRPNVMFVTLQHNESDGTFKLSQLSVLHFVPYITYRLSF